MNTRFKKKTQYKIQINFSDLKYDSSKWALPIMNNFLFPFKDLRLYFM